MWDYLCTKDVKSKEVRRILNKYLTKEENAVEEVAQATTTAALVDVHIQLISKIDQLIKVMGAPAPAPAPSVNQLLVDHLLAGMLKPTPTVVAAASPTPQGVHLTTTNFDDL